MIHEIVLTDGSRSIVDPDQYEELNRYKWSNVKGYAIRCGKKDGKYKTIYMHREVNCTPSGMQTDHINHNKLDNRACNLRTSTRSQNNCNKPAPSNNTSGIKGVSWHKSTGNWRADIKLGGKQKSLGLFKMKIDAAIAYNAAAVLMHGSFAHINAVGQ